LRLKPVAAGALKLKPVGAGGGRAKENPWATGGFRNPVLAAVG